MDLMGGFGRTKSGNRHGGGRMGFGAFGGMGGMGRMGPFWFWDDLL